MLVNTIFGPATSFKSDPNVGHGEALRRSMVELISGQPYEAHPATWAPFVLVGEGAR
jgi:CHAT domain-containing protein